MSEPESLPSVLSLRDSPPACVCLAYLSLYIRVASEFPLNRSRG